MSKNVLDHTDNRLIIIIAIIVSVGLILIQSNWHNAEAFMEEENIRNAKQPTPTKTATPISFAKHLGKCYDVKKAIQTMLARSTGSPSTNYVCGRLHIVKNNKTDKDVLILEPCGKGSYYVFKIRPDELHDYYQLLNVRFENGEEVYTQEYGILSKYISNFSGYYILDNCQACGIKLMFISTAEIIFPTTTGIMTQATIYPSMPPFPTQKEIVPSATSTPTIREPTISPSPSSTSTTVYAPSPTFQIAQKTKPSNAIYLTLLDLRSEPEEPIQNQESILHITVQNLGFPIGRFAWNYSGKVLLKTADGKVLEELDFARDQSSTIRVVESTRVQAETWEITIPIRFSQPVQNGEVEVFIQPLDYLTFIYPESMKSRINVRPVATSSPTTHITPQAIEKPTASQTAQVPSTPSICPGLYTAFLIPVVGKLFLWKKVRRKI